jgi:hypothetical protein
MYTFPVLVCILFPFWYVCTKKNLATLPLTKATTIVTTLTSRRSVAVVSAATSTAEKKASTILRIRPLKDPSL